MTGTWYDAVMKYVNPNRRVPKWQDRFHQQCAYEDEGIAAGKEGKTREDCPYNEATESEAWNFWVYGCENAAGELAAIQAGEVDVRLYTTGASSYKQPPIMMPVGEAVRSGQWSPRHFTPTEVYGLLYDQGFPTPLSGGSGGGSITGGLAVSGGIKVAEVYVTGEDEDDSDLRGC